MAINDQNQAIEIMKRFKAANYHFGELKVTYHAILLDARNTRSLRRRRRIYL